MPTLEEFQGDLGQKGYGFLTRSEKYFKEYLKVDIQFGKFNYTNLCLFRSASQKELLDDDYKSCFETFQFLIQEISPPWILALGTTNIDRIRAIDSNFLPQIKSAGKAKGCTGRLLGKPFYCVPHPNAHLSKSDRDNIWKKVFSTTSDRGALQ